MKSGSKEPGKVPGFYPKRSPSPAVLADRYVREWERRRRARKRRTGPASIPANICISRRIGIGAVQIADLSAKKLGCHVIDRQILEHIGSAGDLSEKTVRYFDERYPGKFNEFVKLLAGEKSFILSDYGRHLISAVYSLAESGPAVFIGRGCHLILPRDRLLAVRLIGSMAYRSRRLAQLMGIDDKDARRQLLEFDEAQRVFFRKLHGKTHAPADDFDLVINLDYFMQPEWVAEIIIEAYRLKFPDSPKRPQ
jgi:hypothetical protein